MAIKLDDVEMMLKGVVQTTSEVEPKKWPSVIGSAGIKNSCWSTGEKTMQKNTTALGTSCNSCSTMVILLQIIVPLLLS
ncbi:hypothetical protein F0562_009239 [Nyssa sinensis]|uniref:Uncharacterized protein n=1 Tax=Nyssa sinensis TaxID=561372 RepID=A0A5J4ZYA5_9ASTE|nr:hypothetical protein F0562_009239 [Nyssa sinensis]